MVRVPGAVVGVFLTACGGSTASNASFDAGPSGADATSDAAADVGSPRADATAGDASVAMDAPVAIDAAGCVLSASNYDQSCSVDTDCVAVTSGNYCEPNQCFCGGSTISMRALAQFQADMAKTPVGSGAVPMGNCGCPVFGPQCCSSGTCQVGAVCFAKQADAAPVDAPTYTPNDTVLCVGDAGPAEGGAADAAAIPGVSRWCMGREQCVTFNGGWACCVLMQGISFCVAP